jgi:hypothetical protein
MNFKRLLTTQTGIFFISLLLGLGLATLFRKVCNDKNCIQFNGPVLADIDGKIFEEDGHCYTYTLTKETCNSNKQIINVKKEEDIR